MKYTAFVALIGLTACMQAAPTPQPNPGLPDMACTVASFASDTGDADFIRANRAKTFDITSTDTGFAVLAMSDTFSDSTTLFSVINVTDDQILAKDLGLGPDSSLSFTMMLDRAAQNGTRRVVQTMQVDTQFNDRGFTQNQWILACRDTA